MTTMVLGGAAAVAASALLAAPAAAANDLVRFVRPTPDTLIEKGTGAIRFIVQTRDGARPTKASVDGVDVTRLLKKGPNGRYGALLNFDRHLNYGFNDAFVEASGRNGARGSDHVRFIAAKRNDRLLKVTSFSTQTSGAALQAALDETHIKAILDVADGVEASAYINNRKVDRLFSQEGSRAVVRLGADDNLRYGRNRIQLLVHRTHPRRRQSSYDIEERTVTISRRAPIAGAGPDATVTENDFHQLDARATKLPPGFGKPSFRWSITKAPKGSKARLRNATGSRPALVPDRPGRYAVRVSVGRAGRPGVASAAQAPAAAANETATITVPPDVPPSGVPLQIFTGTAFLGGQRITSDDCCKAVNYAVVDRTTLVPVDRGLVNLDGAGLAELGRVIDRYTGTLNHVFVLSYLGPNNYGAQPAGWSSVLAKLGGTPADAQRGSVSGQLSVVGVAGAPAGSAFVTPDFLAGTLRRNGTTGKFDFGFDNFAEFDTDASPDALTIKVGDKTYGQPRPGGGVSGFHLLVLDSDGLASRGEAVYTTNDASGAEQVDDIKRLTNELQTRAADPARPLIVLQAFGAPTGDIAEWDLLAKQIERFGGTRQVVNALNPPTPRALNGEVPGRTGGYAFVARMNQTAPLAESSTSANGEAGRLRGVLQRARDGGYEPMLAAPAGPDGQSPVNIELIEVTNQAPQPFPAFADPQGQPVAPDRAQAVQNFLGGPEIMRVCSAAVPACDIRKSYYQSYDANWASIQDDLADAGSKCEKAAGPGFTADECEGIRVQLRDEVSQVAKVTQYFGPLGLQRPYGAAGVAALADVTDIAQQISNAVQPAAGSSTASGALELLSYASKALAATPETTPVGAVLGAAFSIGAYYTKADGGPDLIGPKIRTDSTKLGVELAASLRQAGSNLDDLGRRIVSDSGKLRTVASKVTAQPGPGETDWRIGDIGQAQAATQRGAQATIYSRLVPLAFPVLYDLGVKLDNARDWYCQGAEFFLVDKNLFADQPDSGQFFGRFGSYTGLIAAAAERATGNNKGARIPGVPAGVSDPIFKPIEQGGLGLSKVAFFSPNNGFRFFPAEPHPPLAFGRQQIDSLQMFPFAPGADTTIIDCPEVPDPPGNSG